MTVFQRLTPEARAVLASAQEQAAQLGHEYIGTEHLLLGLVARGDGLAADVLTERGLDLYTVREAVVELLGATRPAPSRLVGPEEELALRSVGIDVDAVRASVEEAFGPGALDSPWPHRWRRRSWIQRRRCRDGGGRGGGPTLAPRAKKALELALREALVLGHAWIGPEHILLGMLKVRACLAVHVVVSRGVDPDGLRQRVLSRLRPTA